MSTYPKATVSKRPALVSQLVRTQTFLCIGSSGRGSPIWSPSCVCGFLRTSRGLSKLTAHAVTIAFVEAMSS